MRPLWGTGHAKQVRGSRFGGIEQFFDVYRETSEQLRCCFVLDSPFTRDAIFAVSQFQHSHTPTFWLDDPILGNARASILYALGLQISLSSVFSFANDLGN